MLNFFVLLTTMMALGERVTSQTLEVPVRSHGVLTNGVVNNQVQNLYDNNVGTPGGFYSLNETTAEVFFDLGKNYILDHVVFTMKRKETPHNISVIVGNLNNGQGGLLYTCPKQDKSSEVYKCEPECRTSNKKRNGIIARNFILRLLVGASWISVYEMKVYVLPLSVSKDISSNRLVLSSNCYSQSWLLIDKSIPPSMSIATTTITDIYFEKSYVINEIQVQFEKTPPTTLNISMISRRGTENNLIIKLSDCMYQRLMFTCAINSKIFSSRRVQINTLGLTKIFIQGKPVFYPKLEIKTSTNIKDDLKMTCEYSPCDLSVHSDCSEKTIKSGMKFDCSNKRLIRMPSGSDLDSLAIVNNGNVESIWKSTRFSVDYTNDNSMSISMPRSFQYFGQYKCACIVADQMNTEIFSEVTKLKEIDFLEDLFFETLTHYKPSENDDTLQSASKNIIYLSKVREEITYITVKVSMLSLIPGNTVNITYRKDIGEDFSDIDRSTPHSIKAFDHIPQSWSVATHKYVSEDIYPDFNHDSLISIKSINAAYNLKQEEYVRMIDMDNIKTKPIVWTINDTKVIQVNIMYSSQVEAKVHYSEKSCDSTKNSVLATIAKEHCKSFDPRLTCFHIKDTYLLTFKDKTDFAKKVTLDIRDVQTNTSVKEVTIKNAVNLNQKDVIIRARYVNLISSLKNKDVNVLKVAIDVLSKKINDFIPCGNVMINIIRYNKDNQSMILQSSSFTIDVEMNAKEVKVTIEVTIDGATGKHITHLSFNDPTTFMVNNFEFQEDKTLNVFWNGIDDIAKDMLKSYELQISTTVLACNSTTIMTQSISTNETSGEKNRYQIALIPLNKNLMTLMTVSIQPLFISDKKSQVQIIKKTFNNIHQSKVTVDETPLPTERSLTVMQSQSDISCDIKDVQFNVTGINVEKYQWKSVSLKKMKYKITNLVPGRKYQLTAKVIYKYGPADGTSKVYTFETADDITIVRTKHVAQLSERVNISCTAEIGPEDRFKKTVEWLRADESALPDGVKSKVSNNNPKVAFLIVEKALADHSGEYGCFARPSASVGSMRVSIIVNDLVVSPIEQQVDFKATNSKVSATCSSSAVRDTKLIWVDPLGVTISEGDSEKYSIVRVMTEQNVDQSTLTIKSPSLDTSGIYKCHKSIGDIKANQEYFLYGIEGLQIKSLTMNSSIVGGTMKLRCKGEAGVKSQKVMWEYPSTKENVTSLIKTFYPDPSDQTVQDIEIVSSLSIHQVTCKLLPPLKESQEPLSKTFQIKFQSNIVVNGPSEVNATAAVNMMCLGYPDSRNKKLEWVFHQKNATAKGKVVMTSDDSSKFKSYEPIKLELNLTNVNQNESGRYECRFKDEMRASVAQASKSISLVVNAVSNPAAGVIDENKKKSTPSSVMYSTALVVALAVLSMTDMVVYPRW